jgi:uncharacterized protein YdiU (UPF0061 family)
MPQNAQNKENQEELTEDNQPRNEDGTFAEDEDVDPDSDEAKKQRANAQIERLKEEKDELKGEVEKLRDQVHGDEEADDQSGGEANPDLVKRTYLAANGIEDEDAQQEVIRLADKFDLEVDKALEDEDIKRRADAIVEKKQAKQSVASGQEGGDGGATKKDADYYQREFEKNGEFPDDTPREMIAEVTERLADDN